MALSKGAQGRDARVVGEIEFRQYHAWSSRVAAMISSDGPIVFLGKDIQGRASRRCGRPP